MGKYRHVRKIVSPVFFRVDGLLVTHCLKKAGAEHLEVCGQAYDINADVHQPRD